MAGQADGSIIVDTELQTEGFERGSKEMQRALRSLQSKVDGLGPTMRKAVAGSATALESFDGRAQALRETIDVLEAKLEELGKSRLPTEEYQRLQTDITQSQQALDRLINKQEELVGAGKSETMTEEYAHITAEVKRAEAALLRLYDRRDKMDDLGVDHGSKQYKNLAYDIDLAARKLDDLEKAQKTLKENGSAYTYTEPYKKIQREIDAAREKLAKYKAEAQQLENGGNAFVTGTDTAEYGRLSAALKEARNNLDQMTARVNKSDSALGKLASTVKKGAAAMLRLSLRARKTHSSFADGLKTMLRYGLGVRSLFVLMNKLRSALVDGYKNLARYSDRTNAAISSIVSALTRLKNSFASAFDPILTSAAPALTTLIDLISEAVSRIGMLTAALTGAKTYTKAVSIQEDYAASLGGTADAAKEAKRALAGFDELNILSDNSADKNSNAGTVEPSTMFEQAPIDSAVLDFASKLREAFENADWKELGTLLGTKINELVDSIDWAGWGTKIGKGLDAAIQTLYYTVDTVDWVNIGNHLGEAVNAIVDQVDFTILGRLLAKKFTVALDLLGGFLAELDWTAALHAFTDGFSGFFDELTEWLESKDWGAIGEACTRKLSDALQNGNVEGAVKSFFASLTAALNSAADFLDGVDFHQLGADLVDLVVRSVSSVDWSALAQAIGRAIGEAGIAALDFCGGLVSQIADYFQARIDEGPFDHLGMNMVYGVLTGINDALEGIALWIYNNLFKPFIDGVCAAFGIHSPSTVMAEVGTNIIAGMIQGIRGAISGVVSAVAGVISDIKQKFTGTDWKTLGKDIISKIKSGVESVATVLPTAIKTIGDNVKKKLAGIDWKNTGSAVIKTIYNGFVAVQTTLPNAIKSIGDNVKKKLTGIDWKNTGSAVIKTIYNGFVYLQDTLPNALKQIAANAKKKFTDVNWLDVGKNVILGIYEGIKNTIRKLVEAAGSAADWLLKAFQTALGINSPSTKGATLGYWFDVGMANGLNDNAYLLEDAAEGLSDTFLGSMDDALDGAGENLALGVIEETRSTLQTNMDRISEALASGSGVSNISGLASAVKDGDWATVAKNVALGIFNSMDTSFKENVSGFVADSLEALNKGFDEQGYVGMLKAAKGIVGDLVSGLNSQSGLLENAGTGIIGSIVKGIQGALGGLWELIASITQKIFSLFSNGFSGIQTGAANLISKLGSLFSMSGVKNAASSALSGIGSLFSGGFSGIVSAAAGAMSKVGAVVSSGLSGVSGTVAGVLSTIGGAVSGGLSGVVSTVGSALGGVGTALTGLAASTGPVGIAVAGVGALGAAFLGAMGSSEKFRDGVTSAFNSVKNVVSNVATGIGNAVSNIWDAAKNVGSTVANGLSSAVSGAVNVGKNIVSGIGNGIKSVASGIGNAVKNVGSGIVNGFKSFFGIHSPSTLMADEVGEFLPPGIGNGIENAMPSLLSRVKGQMAELADTVQDGALAADTALAGSDMPLLSEVSGKVDIVDGVDGVLTSFSDKVSGSFSDLLDRLSAITEKVSFALPNVAEGTVVPYSVESGTSQTTSAAEVAEEVKLSNDELSRLMVQAIGSATTSICAAIEQYSGTNVNLDSDSLTTGVIDNINARIRMTGKSPILTATEV